MPGLDVMGRLGALAEVLRTAERLGAGEDGSERYIQISESLADEAAALLEAVSRWSMATGLPQVEPAGDGPSYAADCR
jgi:hypothetical protein